MRFSLPILALATSAYAQLTITEPSTNHWWVANSINTIKWTGTQPTTFNVFLVNSDSTVLVRFLPHVGSGGFLFRWTAWKGVSREGDRAIEVEA
jgi:hypothetical protein